MKEPLLELSFGVGIDQSLRPEYLDPSGGFSERVNVRSPERGAAEKRLGFAAMTAARLDGSTRTSARRLFTAGKQPCVMTEDGIEVYSPAKNVWVRRGLGPRATARKVPMEIESGSSSVVEDVARIGDLFAVLTQDGSGTFRVTVADRNGAALRATEWVNSPVGDATGLLGAYGVYFFIITQAIADDSIRAFYLDTTSAASITTGWVALGTAGVVKTDATGTYLALSVASLSDRIVVAYARNSGTDRLALCTITTAGVVASAAVGTSSSDIGHTCLSVSGSAVWLTWNITTAIRAMVLSPTLTTTATAATVITLGFTPANASPLIIAASSATAAAILVNSTVSLVVQNVVVTGGAVADDGADHVIGNTYLASRATWHDGHLYAVCYAGSDTDEDNDQSIAVLCEIPTVPPYPFFAFALPVATVDPGLAVVPTLRRASLLTEGETLLTVISTQRTATLLYPSVVTFDFADTALGLAVEHAGSTYLAGGVLGTFDGFRWRETLVARPSKPTFTAGTGTLSPAVGYRWAAVIECVDGDGNVTLSGVSTPSASSGAQTNKNFVVVVKSLGITNRVSYATLDGSRSVRVALYRTTDGGQVYYLVESQEMGSLNTGFTDNLSDAALIARRKLYSQPGLLGAAQDRRSPPGLSALVSYNGMLVGWSGSDLWASGQPVRGEATWFSPVFQTPVEEREPGTALAAIDGSLYAFTARRIYVLGGEAPSDNGMSGGLGAPRVLASDVGCIDPRSVVVTSAGVFFQSVRGIELLTRAQSVDFVGRLVRDTLAEYPEITSATLDGELVRFTCVDGAGAGVTLVFDLELGAWVSEDRVLGTVPAESGALLWLGGRWRFAWMTAAGVVHQERDPGDASAHLDGSTWVQMKVSTAEVHLSGIQGEQAIDRILALCEGHTAHDLTVTVSHDYGVSTEAQTWSAADLATLARPWIDRGLTKHVGQSMRVTMQDVTPSSGTVGSGKGASWIGLTFNGEPRSGPKRTTVGQRGRP